MKIFNKHLYIYIFLFLIAPIFLIDNVKAETFTCSNGYSFDTENFEERYISGYGSDLKDTFPYIVVTDNGSRCDINIYSSLPVLSSFNNVGSFNLGFTSQRRTCQLTGNNTYGRFYNSNSGSDSYYIEYNSNYLGYKFYSNFLIEDPNNITTSENLTTLNGLVNKVYFSWNDSSSIDDHSSFSQKIYIPDEDLDNTCVFIKDKDTLSIIYNYDSTLNKNYNIRNYYYNNNYYYNDTTISYEENLPTCLDSDLLTNNIEYRVDYDKILIILFIYIFFIIYIPFKVFSKIFKKGAL